MRHSFIFLTCYKKGLFIFAYLSCFTAFGSSNPIPNSTPGEADLEIFYDAASYACPSIFFPLLYSLTVGIIIKTLAVSKINPCGHQLQPFQMNDKVTIGLTVCPYLWARLPSYLEINLDTVKPRYKNLRHLNQKNLNFQNGSMIFYLHNTRIFLSIKGSNEASVWFLINLYSA